MFEWSGDEITLWQDHFDPGPLLAVGNTGLRGWTGAPVHYPTEYYERRPYRLD